MPLGTGHMTTTTGDKFRPEVWSEFIIRATESHLVMGKSVKRFDEDVVKYGDVLHLPNLSNLTANDKTASTQVTLQAPTETEITITIDKHKEASFLVEDILKAQSRYDLLKEYTSKAGEAIGKRADRDLIDLQSGLSQIVGTVGSDLSDPVLVSAIQKLDEADAPMDDRTLLILPAQKAALLRIDKFVRADAIPYVKGDSPIVKGIFGDIYGNGVKWTTNLPAGKNLLFHREAFGLAMQKKPRTQSQYKLEFLATLVVVDALYGVAEIRDTFGVLINT